MKLRRVRNRLTSDLHSPFVFCIPSLYHRQCKCVCVSPPYQTTTFHPTGKLTITAANFDHRF